MDLSGAFRKAIFLFTIVLSLGSLADEFTGVVISVYDGDTIRVETENEIYRIRLKGIDAPESKQSFGLESGAYLRNTILGEVVTVTYSQIDFYGRVLGKVWYQDVDMNLEMIRTGFAWHYKYYAKSQPIEDQIAYSEAEIMAQDNDLGLWVEENPMPPWEWRRRPKKNLVVLH